MGAVQKPPPGSRPSDYATCGGDCGTPEIARITENRLRQALRGQRLTERQAVDFVEAFVADSPALQTVPDSEEVGHKLKRRYLIARVLLADEAQLQVDGAFQCRALR
jgi:hypothetical protein